MQGCGTKRVRQSITAGRPEASARSIAGATSSGCVDGFAVAAEAARDRRIVGVVEAGAELEVELRLLAGADDAPGGVVVDEGDHRQLVAPGRVELLQREAERAVAGDVEHRPVGMLQLQRQRIGQAEAELAMPGSWKRVRTSCTGVKSLLQKVVWPPS